MDSTLAAVVLICAGLAWDVLRRFAGAGTNEDMEDLRLLIQTVDNTVNAHQDKTDERLADVDARVKKHGEMLTKAGLKTLGPKT